VHPDAFLIPESDPGARKQQGAHHRSSSCILESILQQDSQPHEVDLHGLYVKEAIDYTDRALQQARTRGDRELYLIVGKGLHSKDGAKIKPAIQQLIHKCVLCFLFPFWPIPLSRYQLSAHLDPTNAGVLIVELNSTRHGVSADEITHRIEDNDDKGCIIM